MSDSASMWPGTPEGEELFAEFLERRESEGKSVNFDDFCAEHSEHAVELRRMFQMWSALEPFLEEAEESADAPELALAGPDRYQRGAELGRGGMGVVLRVRDEHMRRELAMKVVRPEALPVHDPALRRRRLSRFLEEARITSGLSHPGIVPVHDLGVDEDGHPFFTMPVVEGETLSSILERLAEGHPAWNRARVLGVILRVCEAMGFAHARGVIHRDLKPANVMVGPFGETYVMDWGLARMLDDEVRERVRQNTEAEVGGAPSALSSATWTLDGDVVGTPAYMSPEQANGNVELVGSASDAYAVGAILYHTLALHPPFAAPGSGATANSVLEAVRNGPPDSSALRNAPAELVAICEKAMNRDPADRYPDLGAMATDLRAYLEDRVVSAYESGAFAEFRKWVRRHRGLALGAGLALLVGVAGLAATAYVQARGKERVLRLSDLQLLDESIEEATALWPALPEKSQAFREWLQDARGLLRRLPEHEEELSGVRADAAARREHATDSGGWTFSNAELRWQFEKLEELVAGLRAFAGSEGPVPSVERRLAFAETIKARSVDERLEDWEAARDAVLADSRFNGLELAPQMGLVPLGPDPASGFWEFAHLATGTPPQRGDDGLLELEPESAVVLVLLPGGSFLMGATRPDSTHPVGSPNVDVNAFNDLEGPVHEVWVAPFFLSKFEWTRAQWSRVQSGTVDDALHPITGVTWDEAHQTTERVDLGLPTEAQWEYACRAGTTTPFWGTPAGIPLAQAENVNNDLFEVGSRLPNPFGLYDTIGNVMEWCADRFGLYSDWEHHPSTGELLSEDSEDGRVARGAAHAGYVPSESRASQRLFNDRLSAFPLLGLRASRELRAPE